MQILKQKSFTTTSLLSIFILCFLLVIIRWINIFNEDVYVISVAINSHITNFTLSLMMCTLIGYLLLSTGKEYVSTIMAGMQHFSQSHGRLLLLARQIIDTSNV